MNIINILIVEDEEELWAKPMMIQLKRFAKLQKISIQIDLALTADQARDFLKNQRYDLISLDLSLPEHKDDKVSIDCGVKLSQFVSQKHPEVLCCIFSGCDRRYSKRQANVFLKGHGKSGCLNAKGWAPKVLELLRNQTTLLDNL